MALTPFEPGESAVAVPVPAAEPLVSSWRDCFDSSAPYGIPAHVTVTYPFLHESALNDSVLEQLRVECSEVPPFEVTFNRVGRFTTVA